MTDYEVVDVSEENYIQEEDTVGETQRAMVFVGPVGFNVELTEEQLTDLSDGRIWLTGAGGEAMLLDPDAISGIIIEPKNTGLVIAKPAFPGGAL